MKKLIIIRHAKSSWKFNVIDHERPLNDRGVNDSGLISNHLKNNNLNLDLILSSDAERAKSTANIFVSNLDINHDIFSLSHELYDFSGENLLNTIKSCDNSVNNLMVFGHNHAITSFVNTFGDIYIENVPTCGVVIIKFEIDSWQDLVRGKTIYTLFPKDLK